LAINLASTPGARRRRLLILVDDAHWLDSGSLRFLLYLVQRIEELPVSMVLAWRSGELLAPDDLLSRLGSGPWARFICPSPLSLAAVQRLVRSRLGPRTDQAF